MLRLTVPRCLLALATLAAAYAWMPASAQPRAGPAVEWRYDTQVAWINAGELVLWLRRNEDLYRLSGQVATSPMMSRFMRWRGHFVATGRFEDGWPHTNAYLLRGDRGDGTETRVLFSFGGRTTIRHPDGEHEEMPQPEGSDFVSVTFLAPHCVAASTLHDGERIYRVANLGQGEDELQQRSPYYSGPAERCDYLFKSSRNTRRVSLWLADWRGHRLPVLIRVRVPLLPDGWLRLRVRAAPLVDALAAGGDRHASG